MTAQQYFNAHKGERMHVAQGFYGRLVGYHDNPNGFERLIVEMEINMDVIGWRKRVAFDFIPDDVTRTGSGYFAYLTF